MIELLKQIGLLLAEKLKMLDPAVTILIIVVCGLGSFYLITGRSDKQIQDAITLGREKDCQIELIKCRQEKDYDNRFYSARADSLNRYWGMKYDEVINMIIENKLEIQTLKNKRK